MFNFYAEIFIYKSRKKLTVQGSGLIKFALNPSCPIVGGGGESTISRWSDQTQEFIYRPGSKLL